MRSCGTVRGAKFEVVKRGITTCIVIDVVHKYYVLFEGGYSDRKKGIIIMHRISEREK